MGAEKKKGFLGGLRSEFGFVSGNFLILLSTWLFLDFAGELPGTYYPLYVEVLGGTASTIGLIGAIEAVSRGVVQIPGGYLADKYGRKQLIVSMTFVAAFSRIFFFLAPSWEWVAFGAFLVGVTNIYGPALTAIVADSVPKERRGMAFSIMHLIESVSTTPAPLMAGFLYSQLGLVTTMRLAYGLMVLALVAAAVLRLRLVETVAEPQRFSVRDLASSFRSSLGETFHVWSLLPGSAVILLAINVATGFAIGIFQPVFTLYVVQDLKIDPVSYSYIMTTMFASMIIVAIPVGKLIDKIGKKKPLVAAGLIAVLWVPLALYGDFIRLIASVSLTGVMIVLYMSAGNSLFADLVPRAHRGKANGALGFFTMVSMAAGQLTGGWLFDNVGHQIPFIVHVAVMLVSTILVVIYVHEPAKTED